MYGLNRITLPRARRIAGRGALFCGSFLLGLTLISACQDDTPCHDGGTKHDAAVPQDFAMPPVHDFAMTPADMAPNPVQLGSMIADKNHCHSCHDPNDAMAGVLSGKTVPVMGTMAYPANITPDTTTGIGSWSDDDITRAVRTGYDDGNMQLCPTMPIFNKLTDDDMKNLIAYLRSIPAVNRAIPDSSCPPIK